MLAALSPARRRLILLCLVALVVAVGVVTAVLVRTGGNPVTPVAQDRPGPVLLVPGYGGSTAGLEVLAADLRADGRDARVLPLPGDGRGDLREQAQALADAAAATGAESIDVIGYSAGGVVARLWVRDFGGGNLARRVVTLGSPHHGADLAGLARDLAPSQCPLACQQLQPDSDLLRALNAGDETPPGPEFISVWTALDEVVTPPESARLDGALDLRMQSICPESQVSHSELPVDPLVANIVALQLAATPPVPLSTADCARLSS
ncbi:lipase [soil metagenome]